MQSHEQDGHLWELCNREPGSMSLNITPGCGYWVAANDAEYDQWEERDIDQNRHCERIHTNWPGLEL
eukprot:7164246-Prorocentrum_lima.AAC.1